MLAPLAAQAVSLQLQVSPLGNVQLVEVVTKDRFVVEERLRADPSAFITYTSTPPRAPAATSLSMICSGAASRSLENAIMVPSGALGHAFG